jgi:hypothetical protein
LVNLWSAVECLCGASQAQSILGQVIDVLTPVVIFQRTEKTLRYIAIQVAKLQAAGSAADLGDGFIRSRKLKNFILPEELFLVLCRPENHPEISQLLACCGPHSFLRNRIFALWQLFHKPEAIGRKLRSARQTIEWHIARIYRARNLIVHEGVEAPHIPWLLDHLHYYFSAVCSRVLEALGSHPDWRVEEASLYWRMKCDYQLMGLNEFPDRLMISDFFRFPRRDMASLKPWSGNLASAGKPSVSPSDADRKGGENQLS